MTSRSLRCLYNHLYLSFFFFHIFCRPFDLSSFILQVILADSGYGCSRHIIPLYKELEGMGNNERRARRRFNRLAASTRIIVEQAIGTLKMRFPILMDGLRLRPRNCSRVILCCITLHNFLINTGGGFYDAYEEDKEQDSEGPEREDAGEEQNDEEGGEIVRDALCQMA